MPNLDKAYELLLNGSVIKGSNEAYQSTIGVWFWPLIFIFTLTLLAIKSENPAYVAFYAITGNIVLAGFLPIATHPIFYGILVFSLALVFWSIYASKKVD